MRSDQVSGIAESLIYKWLDEPGLLHGKIIIALTHGREV
jgi:hypothetical protein